MSGLGWLLQPAVLPWVALALGLCIGSFLNVVIHRLPKMMEREWRGEWSAAPGEEPPQEGCHKPVHAPAPASNTPGSSCSPDSLRPIRLGASGPRLLRLARRYSSGSPSHSRSSTRKPASSPS